MNTLFVMLLGFAAQGSSDDPKQDVKARLLELHKRDAAEYAIYLDASMKVKLELRDKPVYLWTNPTRSGGQEGAVFVWTHHGRPEVVATIFSHPEAGRRVLCHEFHSLSLSVIKPVRAASNRWLPQAGIELKPIPGAPAPAESAAQRLTQLRSLAREFAANSVDEQGERWELRLLPQPLYRYESTDAAVLDGGVFTFVTSAGTDPELIIAIEARRTADGYQWQWTAARFSDLNLWLRHKNAEVWTSIRSAENTFDHDAKHRFRFYRDKIVDEIKEVSP